MSNKKKERVYIRLTTEEKISLIANAERYGTSISDLVRKKLLQPSAIFLEEKERVELKELLKEARDINRTLNLYHEKRQERSEERRVGKESRSRWTQYK